jgi:glycosyltransferase involved in cell wall biosynthesis
MEALACGACLVTPRVGHGLEDLFTDEVDLFLYDQNNLEALAELVKKLLQNPALCARVAAGGLEKVNSRHLGGHRALLLHAVLQNLRGDKGERLVRERLMQKNSLHAQYLKLIYLLFAESLENPGLRRAYLAAAKTGAP